MDDRDEGWILPGLTFRVERPTAKLDAHRQDPAEETDALNTDALAPDQCRL